MKKTLAGLVLGASLLFPSTSKAVNINSFSGSPIDTGLNIISSPAVVIDRFSGVEHIVYGRQDQLVNTNSNDFGNKIILDSTPGQYSSPVIKMHGAGAWYAAYNRDNHTYFVDSNHLTPVDVGLGVQMGEQIDVDVDSLDRLYVAGQKNNGANGTDVYVLRSTDGGLTFNEYLHVDKPGNQGNPKIAIQHAGNIVTLVYGDDSEGNGTYKTKFRQNIDNFASEQDISPANQSYSAEIQPGIDGNFWVAYKDTTQTFPGYEFESGMIWVADRNSGWQRTQVTGLIGYLPDRPLAFVIDDSDKKYLSWSTGTSTVDIHYADSDNFSQSILVDSATNNALGYVDLDTAVNHLYVAANIHSIYNFEGIHTDQQPPVDPPTNGTPEPSTFALMGLAGIVGAGYYCFKRRK